MWKTKIKINTNKDKVVGVKASYVTGQTAEGADIVYVTHQRRVDLNSNEDRLAFKAECVAKLNELNTEKTKEEELEALANNFLNN